MHGEYKMPGGKLVVIDLEVRDGHLAQVQLSGDFFLEPDAALAAINAALEGLPAQADAGTLTEAIGAAVAEGVMMFGISPEAVAEAVHRALQPGSAT